MPSELENPLISSATSELLPDVQNANKWIFDRIKPYIRGRCLELNSGINSLCPFFLLHKRPIHLSDSDPIRVQRLKDIYKDNPVIRKVHSFDFESSNFKDSNPNTLDVFDTVIALQVANVEWRTTMENIKYVLPSGGSLILMIPAYTSIFNGLGQYAEAWEKYNSKNANYLHLHNFSILKVRYTNLDINTVKGFYPHVGLSSLIIVSKN